MKKVLFLYKYTVFLLAVSVFILFSNMPKEINTNQDFDDRILYETDDVGQAYIENIYFIGDSTTYHFHKVGIKMSHILVPDSLTLKLDSRIADINVLPHNTSIANSLNMADAKLAIITLGVNGADSFNEKAFKTYYKKLIASIRATSPNTDIILQSIFPVAEWYSNEGHGITNKGIDKLNLWIRDIVKEEQLYYLDTQSVLKNQNGALITAYEVGDGVHLNSSGYQAIIEYIRTHALIKE